MHICNVCDQLIGERDSVEAGYFFTKQLKVLHIAPELIFSKIFNSLSNLNYISADISSKDAMIKMDITDTPNHDNNYDVILCYHVLEHIIDDRKAYPLIAIREFILSRKSLGGIQTDLSCRVMKDDISGNGPIEGLYAVGEAAGFGGGGIHGKRALEGTFLGTCIYTARTAAETIKSNL